ncbi:MAG: hypothetical protein U9P38_08855 [Campylobacterota bacterium]|nr:hypothetical protein [Campylobacterota bacterium]
MKKFENRGEISKMNLKCTKKLLDILNIKTTNQEKIPNINKDIENWHCNIIDFGEIYGVLITNDKTLFSFYIFGLEKSDFKDFSEIIKQNIFKTMLNMGLEQKKFEVILESMENIQFNKTDDRKVLASMNQMLNYIYGNMEQEKDLLEINIGLNNMIQTKLELKIPRKQLELLLEECI